MRMSDWSSDVCSSDLLQRQSVDLIVEHPAERTAPRPFLQPGTNAFRVALTEQLAQRENGPVLRREASKRGQPHVHHTHLCATARPSDRRHPFDRKIGVWGKGGPVGVDYGVRGII